jgi:capsular exopolysaccharide synthesis family protein
VVARSDDVSETPSAAYTQADIDALVDQDASVVRLFDQLAADEERLNRHKAQVHSMSRSPGGDPTVKKLRDNVAATKELIRRRRAEMRPIVIRHLEKQGAAKEVVQKDELAQERQMLEDLESRLKEEVKSISVVNQKMTVSTLDLQTIQDDVAQMEAVATKVSSEVEALNVELGAAARITSLDDAVAPLTRDDKKRFAIIGLAVFGSFFGGLFGIAFLELQSRKVDSADEVPTDLGLHVVGTLPIVRSKPTRGGIAVRKTEHDRYCQNMMLESIDATRTMLVHAAHTGSHRVVMITSAVGGEGKTSLASHLSTSMARSGLRTLLIDADLRSPSIHKLFDLPISAGLSELLRGEIGLSGAVSSTSIDGLKVLTAGICDRQTISLLAQGCLGPIFVQLKEQFDFVIVDSSPLLPVADGLLIAQHVDAALFSIFRDISSKTKVLAASDRLQALGVQILGAVVTGTHGGRYGNNYNPYSSYAALPESVAGSSGSSK